MTNSIDKNRIKDNLELISFPRLSGTESEKKVFKLIKEKIEELGLIPEVQTFKFSTFYSRVYPKITFPLLFWAFFTLLLGINSMFIILNLVLIFLIFLPFFIITRKPENIQIGKIFESQNLYVKLNADNMNKDDSDKVDKKSNILFIAHLDSKGQTITARTRALTMFLLAFSLISISIILVLRTAFSKELYFTFTYIGIIPLGSLFVGSLVFIFNRTNNKSKGVVDDASGVVCVLELLTYYADRKMKLKNSNLWFVFTGAEESGTMGIRFFSQVLENVNPNKAIVNNFESLGKSVNILASRSILSNNPNYYKHVVEISKNYGFRAIINPFTLGFHTDGIYLLRKKYNTFEFGSSEVGKYMHSKNDSLENVDSALMGKLCEFIIHALNFLEI